MEKYNSIFWYNKVARCARVELQSIAPAKADPTGESQLRGMTLARHLSQFLNAQQAAARRIMNITPELKAALIIAVFALGFWIGGSSASKQACVSCKCDTRHDHGKPIGSPVGGQK